MSDSLLNVKALWLTLLIAQMTFAMPLLVWHAVRALVALRKLMLARALYEVRRMKP